MGVKIFQLSNECKNILGIKWLKKYFWFQTGVKNLGVKSV